MNENVGAVEKGFDEGGKNVPDGRQDPTTPEADASQGA
jgi:hypothetical protein